MATPILATKLYIPPPRSNVVLRPRLIARLNAGLQHKLILISAPAGFGKTTLLASWLRRLELSSENEALSTAWLSLDAGDNEATRFLTYLVAALQTVAPTLGRGVAAALQSPQPPPVEALLTTLLNELTALPHRVVLVLDDYHLVEASAVDQTLTFLLDHLPPHLHLVIATREDPALPLARLRARDQLSELRAADLRFTPVEAAEFLIQVMGLKLSADEIAALESRTEGWIAGLHLAALSLQGQPDAAGFIASFTGSHRFVLDYLVEEVLHRQPAHIQTFLLHTAILERLCAPLCDALLKEDDGWLTDEDASASHILAYLEHANLFLFPLDNERHWYRYHRLFADLLRQRLQQHYPDRVAPLHLRASRWYADQGLGMEAFYHATAAHDIERAERLIDGKSMPLHFRGAVTVILDWLAALPKTVLDARPSLWVKSATLALVCGRTTGVEEKLQAAEAALTNPSVAAGLDERSRRNLIGQIAAARATLALTRYQAETIFVEARRALEYLPAENLPFRFTACWTLAFAHHLQGDRAAAGRTYTEAVTISQASGDSFSTILATDSLAQIQELENQLHAAAESYGRVLELSGDHPQPNAGEAHLGMARIYYEWNDLEAAERHAQQSLQLLRQYDTVIDRFILAELFLARLKLAQGDVVGAARQVAQAEQAVRRHNFAQRMPEVAAAQVPVLLRQGNLPAAAQLAQRYDLPLCRARVQLAQGAGAAALALLEPLRRQAEAKGWQDERLKVLVLQALALHADGETERALQLLGAALALAAPGGFIRLFVDEGQPMAQLLTRMHDAGSEMQDYVHTLLTACGSQYALQPVSPISPPLPEPLSRRELEVLRLIARGLSNHEISERLCIALSTVKGHSRNIFDKLQVQRRTEAVARARELGLL